MLTGQPRAPMMGQNPKPIHNKSPVTRKIVAREIPKARDRALTDIPFFRIKATDDVKVRRVVSPELQVSLERIARLESENRRLESENERLLEQFVRWAYNAHTRGLDQYLLDRPLPHVDRGQS